MAPTNKRSERANNQRGSTTIEFCLSALLWMPLLLGTTVFGINLIHAIQLSQLSRDTGHMYAYGIDFTQSQNLPLLQRLSSSLNIQQHGGDGAIVLSKITLVTDSDCAAANMKVCANDGKYVFTSFYVFGNPTYAQTKLGNPGSYLFNGTAIQESQYLSDPSLVATNFSSLLTFLPNQPGQYAFVSEVSINSQAIAWTDFSNTGSYARTIF
jgi:hypothetical protein